MAGLAFLISLFAEGAFAEGFLKHVQVQSHLVAGGPFSGPGPVPSLLPPRPAVMSEARGQFGAAPFLRPNRSPLLALWGGKDSEYLPNLRKDWKNLRSASFGSPEHQPNQGSKAEQAGIGKSGLAEQEEEGEEDADSKRVTSFANTRQVMALRGGAASVEPEDDLPQWLQMGRDVKKLILASVKEFIEHYDRHLLGVEVKIEDLDFDRVAEGILKVTGLTLSNPEGFNPDKSLLYVEEVLFDIDMIPFILSFGKKVEIKHVSLKNTIVFCERKRSTTNLQVVLDKLKAAQQTLEDAKNMVAPKNAPKKMAAPRDPKSKKKQMQVILHKVDIHGVKLEVGKGRLSRKRQPPTVFLKDIHYEDFEKERSFWVANDIFMILLGTVLRSARINAAQFLGSAIDGAKQTASEVREFAQQQASRGADALGSKATEIQKAASPHISRAADQVKANWVVVMADASKAKEVADGHAQRMRDNLASPSAAVTSGASAAAEKVRGLASSANAAWKSASPLGARNGTLPKDLALDDTHISLGTLPEVRTPNGDRISLTAPRDDRQTGSITFTISSMADWRMDQVERQAEAALQKQGLAKSSLLLYDQLRLFTKDGIELDNNYAVQHPEGPPALAYPLIVMLPVAKGQQEGDEAAEEEVEQEG